MKLGFLTGLVAAAAVLVGATVYIDDNLSPDTSLRVERVIDGDTIVLTDSRTVRLAIVNAPELDECGGPASADLVKDLAENTQVKLRRPNEAPQTDRYGRTVAEVLIQTSGGYVSLNELVVLTGSGTVASQFAKEDINLTQRLKSAQVEAQQQRSGIWVDCISLPERDWRPYENCAEARKLYDTPLFKGEPGYQEKLDADLDGIACT